MKSDDTIQDGSLLDTPDKRGDGNKFYSISSSDRHYDRHCYHPYRRIDRGYFPYEFKKAKSPNFDGYLKKPEDVEVWLLGMKKLFEFHEYIENMKARIAIFILRGKSNI